MANWLIFGIDGDLIVIWAEIGVAFGTIALAIVTYLTVKTSKETLDSLKSQIDIAKKEFENKQIILEKPQIIDQLQRVVNPLSNKIDQELNQIDEKSLLWNSKKIGKPEKFFKIDSSIEFYNEADTTTRIGTIINEIRARFPEFIELCQKRRKIFLSIADLFEKIYHEIEKPEIDNKIGELIYKKNLSHEVFFDSGYSDEMVDLIDYYDEIPTPYQIPLTNFSNTIINIGIAKMLMQRINTQDIFDRMICLEFSSYENDFQNLLGSETATNYSKIFSQIIEDLKDIDLQLKTEIVKIRVSYKENYHLNDNECWTTI